MFFVHWNISLVTKGDTKFIQIPIKINSIYPPKNGAKAYNKSDSTYGFAGSINMFDIYFLHYPVEYTDHSDGRSYTLSSVMAPRVVVRFQRTVYLGTRV